MIIGFSLLDEFNINNYKEIINLFLDLLETVDHLLEL